MIISIVFMVIFGLISGIISYKKGNNFGIGFLLGALLGIIGIIIVAVQKDNSCIENVNIDEETRHKIYEIFCNEIRATLKAPSTAVFCKEEELIINQVYGIYLASGWVDSQNSYGAMIRTYYNKFKIENKNGVFVPKSNARVIASNKLAGTLAGYWVYGIIATIITGAIFYFIINASI